jgi:anti-anti-sigma factor
MTLLEMDQVVVLEPHGDLRAGAECDELEDALAALADRGRSVVADLSATQRLSARSLGILASAHRRAVARGGRVAICGVNRFERWLLARAHLTEVLTIYENRDTAVRELMA